MGILSLILAPPSIAKRGLEGVSIIFEKNKIYLYIKFPATLIGKEIPAIELCALCAVPNASLT